MARKNRVVCRDAFYHVTSRVVNRAFLLADPAFKDEMAEWIYGVAGYCGVDVLAWCIMDNHFHLLVHVPEVPERYRTGPAVPDSHAFGMRPPECNPPRWEPAGGEDGAPTAAARPETGFSMSDEEMLGRLAMLYGARRARAVRLGWERLRADGRGAEVEAEKDRHCRRMYNLSLFVKTLKERVAQRLNRRTGRRGQLWDGRFHSGVVEGSAAVLGVVAAYIGRNPVRAGIVRSPACYRWSSLAQALGDGTHAERCRAGYERLLGRPWDECRRVLLAATTADDAGRGGGTALREAWTGASAVMAGAFVGVGEAFAAAVSAAVPVGFPCASVRRCVARCRTLAWSMPGISAA